MGSITVSDILMLCDKITLTETPVTNSCEPYCEENVIHNPLNNTIPSHYLTSLIRTSRHSKKLIRKCLEGCY